ncbi:hypothetical protein [Paenibacillus sp. GM2]|uniref:hypothetical protein n=1 Tax=Paenibacillus sp. GM2 TaxID=1622070 RepID=UPI00189FF970|nr:hypothetical protein [Paenibacillus sp. GM2]
MTACVIGFARALGEFEPHLMTASHIPGRTKMLLAVIYMAVESGDTKLGLAMGRP